VLPVRTGPTTTAPSTDQLAVDLRVSLLRTARRLRAQKSVDELSDAHFSVLSLLFTRGPRTPGELAEADHVRPPSMTRTIAGLVDQGFVARTDHPDDGRQVLISLTDAGRGVVEDTRARRAAWLGRRLETLSEADRATLAEAARILRTVIGE
jgi:DNA-binding MarR family transcriptional regulator